MGAVIRNVTNELVDLVEHGTSTITLRISSVQTLHNVALLSISQIH